MPPPLVAYPSDDVPLPSWARYSMTNLPFSFTTAGLKVPADSKPLPRGDSIGSEDSRLQEPKGGRKAAPKAAKARSSAAHSRDGPRRGRAAPRKLGGKLSATLARPANDRIATRHSGTSERFPDGSARPRLAVKIANPALTTLSILHPPRRRSHMPPAGSPSALSRVPRDWRASGSA